MDNDTNFKDPLYISSTSIPFVALFKAGKDRTAPIIVPKAALEKEGELLKFLQENASKRFDLQAALQALPQAKADADALFWKRMRRVTSIEEMRSTLAQMQESKEGKVVVFSENTLPGHPHSRVSQSLLRPILKAFVC